MLRARPDVVYAEVLAARDGEAYTYHVESTRGVDIRKSLFFAFSAKGWALVGMEALGMSLEDIFLEVTKEEPKKRRSKKKTAKEEN